jgi:hypothetical protein
LEERPPYPNQMRLTIAVRESTLNNLLPLKSILLLNIKLSLFLQPLDIHMWPNVEVTGLRGFSRWFG